MQTCSRVESGTNKGSSQQRNLKRAGVGQMVALHGGSPDEELR